jgi:glycerol-3-phosphate dehydrogenase
MTTLTRDPAHFSDENYDLIIVGGGIYGVMLSYEAIRRNLRPLMLEKNDFSNATSLNHLRTVHGGLRYLQKLDLPRFMESVSERKWFLQHLPQFVQAMPCIMPLYGKGLHRNWILRMALLLNDVLSFNRNSGVLKEKHLPHGQVISAQRTAQVFQNVDKKGLKGSALWYDGSIQEFQRLLMEIVNTSAFSGAQFLNYVEAKELLTSQGSVTGVVAQDLETRKSYEFKAPIVINAAGPWCRDIATQFDKDNVSLFKKRLLLWNVLFDREALSDYALGLTPERGKGRSYFFHPWKNRLLVGTGEIVVAKSETETTVPDDDMAEFIANINKMAPGIDLAEKDILRVYSGILPATEGGDLANREIILDHTTQDGPIGLYSVSGVKFTTSRLVAEKALNKIFRCPTHKTHQELLDRKDKGSLSFKYDWNPTTETDLNILKDIVAKESVLHLSDLVLRRTSLGDNPKRALKILPQLKTLFQWDSQRWDNEVAQLKKELALDNY